MSDPGFFASEDLDLRWIDGHYWLLTHPLEYPYRGHRVVVPFGFRTDFASIPRVLWNILPPTGAYGKAAVLHDFLYQFGTWSRDGAPCTRMQADAVLYAAMVESGVRIDQRWAIYLGVRCGGWATWNSYREVA